MPLFNSNCACGSACLADRVTSQGLQAPQKLNVARQDISLSQIQQYVTAWCPTPLMPAILLPRTPVPVWPGHCSAGQGGTGTKPLPFSLHLCDSTRYCLGEPSHAHDTCIACSTCTLLARSQATACSLARIQIVHTTCAEYAWLFDLMYLLLLRV